MFEKQFPHPSGSAMFTLRTYDHVLPLKGQWVHKGNPGFTPSPKQGSCSGTFGRTSPPSASPGKTCAAWAQSMGPFFAGVEIRHPRGTWPIFPCSEDVHTNASLVGSNPDQKGLSIATGPDKWEGGFESNKHMCWSRVPVFGFAR